MLWEKLDDEIDRIKSPTILNVNYVTNRLFFLFSSSVASSDLEIDGSFLSVITSLIYSF